MKSWGLKRKLYAAVTALAFTGVLSVVLDQWTLRRVSLDLEEAVDRTAVRIDRIHAVRVSTWEAETHKRGVYLAMTLKDTAMGRRFDAQMESSLAALGKQLRDLHQLVDRPEEQGLVREIESKSQRYARLVRQFSRTAQSEKFDEIPGLVAQIVPLVDDLGRLGDSLASAERNRLTASSREAAQARTRSLWWSGLVTLVLLGCVGAAIAVSRSVGGSLQRTCRELKASSDSVSASAREFSSTSHSIAQGSSELAATMQETAASSRVAKAAAETNQRSVKEASDLAESTNRHFDAGDKAIGDMVAAMRDIQSSSVSIAKIIKVIDEIAFQTSILSLNAAVEAARAGEFGTGFAVVAEEVRNLSDRCARAAKDTAELIEECMARSDRGQGKVTDVSQMVLTARTAIAEMNAILERIRQGGVEQTRHIDQIATAIQQVDQVAQRNAAAAEQSASAATELEAQARALDGVVASLAGSSIAV